MSELAETAAEMERLGRRTRSLRTRLRVARTYGLDAGAAEAALFEHNIEVHAWLSENRALLVEVERATDNPMPEVEVDAHIGQVAKEILEASDDGK